MFQWFEKKATGDNWPFTMRLSLRIRQCYHEQRVRKSESVSNTLKKRETGETSSSILESLPLVAEMGKWTIRRSTINPLILIHNTYRWWQSWRPLLRICTTVPGQCCPGREARRRRQSPARRGDLIHRKSRISFMEENPGNLWQQHLPAKVLLWLHNNPKNLKSMIKNRQSMPRVNKITQQNPITSWHILKRNVAE